MMDAQKALSYAEGYMTALAAVLQDREYTDGKVGNITMTTAEVKKLLRDVAPHTGCDANELKDLRKDNEDMKEQVHNLLELMKEKRGASEQTEQIAKWEENGVIPADNPGKYVTAWKCSNCGKIITGKTAYCPGCGARMEVSGDAD